MHRIDLLPYGLDLGHGRRHIRALYLGIDDGPVLGCPEHERGRLYEVLHLAVVKVLHDPYNGHLVSIFFEITECDLLPDRFFGVAIANVCLLYTSPSPRDGLLSRMPSS